MIRPRTSDADAAVPIAELNADLTCALVVAGGTAMAAVILKAPGMLLSATKMVTSDALTSNPAADAMAAYGADGDNGGDRGR
jgi:hypothetical protein